MFSKIKNYIQNQITLAKLEVVEKLGKVTAAIVFLLIVLLFSLFLFTFLCISGAYFLSIYFESYAYGFLAMSGIFAILLLLFFIFKKGIKNVIVNIVISAAMNDKEHKRVK